jgi:hypothetical protein
MDMMHDQTFLSWGLVITEGRQFKLVKPKSHIDCICILHANAALAKESLNGINLKESHCNHSH